MHDGSVATLREVVDFYNRGGEKNPWLDSKMKPLGLTETEIDALVEFMKALEGEGYQDTPPTSFPQQVAGTDRLPRPPRQTQLTRVTYFPASQAASGMD
jgi:cytochrome c peroxidase